MPKLISETDYFNGCPSSRQVQSFRTREEARKACAAIIRSARKSLDIAVIRDRAETFFITNVQGERVFERTVRVQS